MNSSKNKRAAARRVAARQCCAALYDQSTAGLLSILVVGALLLVIANQFAPHLDFTLWYTIVVGTIAARYGVTVVYQRAQHIAKAQTWIFVYFAGAFVVAAQITWIAIKLTSLQDVVLSAVVSTIMFGTATGAIPVLAAAWRGYILYILVLLLPLVFSLGLPNPFAGTAMSTDSIFALCGVLLIFVLTGVSLNYSRAIKRGNLSEQDPLTQCANRRLLERALKTGKMPTGANPGILALFDLDRFKAVNDTAGHDAGDRVLIQIARYLEREVENDDVVSRIGGDEFAVLFSNRDSESVIELIEKLRVGIYNQNFHYEAHTFQISSSIGYADFDPDDATYANIIAYADIAAYAAKKSGGNRVRKFSLKDQDILQNQSDIQWRTRIKNAIENDGMSLVCQEIVPANRHRNTNKLWFEVLIRMKGKDGELIPAAKFIPVVERLGLTSLVDRWVVQRTIEWARNNTDLLDRVQWFTINLSVRTVGDKDFSGFVEKLLTESGIPGNKICFELTEHEAILDYDSVLNFMNQLSAMGCRFALDDFGTGYSSLRYLDTLPVEIIKIDRAFIKDASTSTAHHAILQAIKQMAGSLDKTVVAEGVEDGETVAVLEDLGIELMQGYHIMMPESLDAWSARQHTISDDSTLEEEPTVIAVAV